MDPIMYIIINTDLKMRQGRIAAQVGHIVQNITEEIIRDSYETTPIPAHCITYMKWKKKCTKVILGATEVELRLLLQHPEARYFMDNIVEPIGITSLQGDSKLTVVGFFPSSIIGSQLETFKLI